MSQQPNIVVAICHDLGRMLGCYGVDWVRTPQIDQFAASATRFSRAFCAAPQCSPSRAAMWTGRYPHANGVVGLTHSGFQNDLHPAERHMAQILGDAGYETHLFGIQHESPSAERCGYQHIHSGGAADILADSFAELMATRPGDAPPFFAQFGFFEPHRPFPYEDVELLEPEDVVVPPYLPDIPEIRQDLVDFEASAACADRAFGRVLQTLQQAGLADNTMVVFTADHGIPFPGAKMGLADAGLEIPFIWHLPGQSDGRVVHGLFSNVDFGPTLLELLGMSVPANLHGRSCRPMLDGQQAAGREAIFGEKTYHTYYDPMRCMRTPQWKLIANFEFAPVQETSPDYDDNAKSYVEVARALNRPKSQLYRPPFELYDLENDPAEQNNLADDPVHGEIRDHLARRLRQWMVETADPLLDGPIPQGAYVRRMARFKEI